MTSRLASDYQQAREGFLASASAAGARLDTYPHPDRGPDGGELAVDIAWMGPEDSDSLVIVVSGTHGVEGFAGSALQARWLTQNAGDVPEGTRMALVHALNPYGFAWVRRTNEDNVDLNRNFIDFADPPKNERYPEIADVLVPETWDQATQDTTLAQLLGLIETWGMDALQEAVSGGQYRYPKGLFYGGSGPTWNNRLLHDLCHGPFAGYDRTVIIDLHTGLGPWGVGELLSSHATTSVEFERDVGIAGDDLHSVASGDSVSAVLAGEWIAAACSWLAPGQTTAFAIEFGVLDIVEVLLALRADAWLHGHGDPLSADAAPIKEALRRAFIDDDPAWLETIWERFSEVLARVHNTLAT